MEVWFVVVGVTGGKEPPGFLEPPLGAPDPKQVTRCRDVSWDPLNLCGCTNKRQLAVCAQTNGRPWELQKQMEQDGESGSSIQTWGDQGKEKKKKKKCDRQPRFFEMSQKQKRMSLGTKNSMSLKKNTLCILLPGGEGEEWNSTDSSKRDSTTPSSPFYGRRIFTPTLTRSRGPTYWNAWCWGDRC